MSKSQYLSLVVREQMDLPWINDRTLTSKQTLEFLTPGPGVVLLLDLRSIPVDHRLFLYQSLLFAR